MDHVGVGEQHPGLLPGQLPGGGRRVAVVGGRLHLSPGEKADAAQLVLSQSFGGVEVDGASVRVAEQAVEHGQVEAQTLAGGRPGGDHEVLAALTGVPAFGLVGPQALDPLGGQGVGQLQMKSARQIGRPAGAGRQDRLVLYLREALGGEEVEQRASIFHR